MYAQQALQQPVAGLLPAQRDSFTSHVRRAIDALPLSFDNKETLYRFTLRSDQTLVAQANWPN